MGNREMEHNTVLTHVGISPESTQPRDLLITWSLSFGSMVLAFPFYTLLVFKFGMDRDTVADYFALHVAIAYWIGISAALLPLPGVKQWQNLRRIQSVCFTFMLVSYCTHLSWELGWLILHEQISAAKDSVWAYTWWAYIDGGDIRYYNPEANFLMIEVLSVCNGTIGMAGLFLLFRSRLQDYRGTLLCMSTAVTHTVLTWYYFGTEILTGFESVNVESFFDLWIKFVFLNAPWLVFPWLVLYWGAKILPIQLGKQQHPH